MASRIFKYEITLDAPTQMPRGAEILSVGAQGGRLFVWAAVDPDDPVSQFHIYAHPTGAILPMSPGRFLGTVQMAHPGGIELVWHLYLERIR